MSNDSETMMQFNELQETAQRLFSDVNFSDVASDIKDKMVEIKDLQGELERARSRGYVFAAYLEQKIMVLAQQWEAAQRELHTQIEREIQTLRVDHRQVETLLRGAESQVSNEAALANLLPALEREISDLDGKVHTAQERLRQPFAELENEIYPTEQQLQAIHTTLDERDEASFPFAAGENVFLTAKAEWVVTGKGNQDPDGILYLTDQRLVFEQKEKTGKKLGLFGGKDVQELEWAIPLNQIEEVKAENKGLFGGKDMLNFTLGSGAPHPKITVEVKGGVASKFWAAQIQRMVKGETTDERAIPADPELLAAARKAPTACPICGATLPQLMAGQTELKCGYCGAVISA